MTTLLRICLEAANEAAKRPKKIKGYKCIETSEENVKEWKKKYSNLSHVKTGSDFDGVILIDDETFVAVLQCNIKTGYVVALEVSNDYRRKGIADALLNSSRRNFNCDKLTVRKTNKNALALYEKKGYETFKDDGFMLYMEKK